MNNLWKLKALVLEHIVPPKDITSKLNDAHVPVSGADCRSCPDPCDQGHEEYPKRLDVDMSSELLGTVKPYRRVVIISTGKSDWGKDVTEVEGSLAAHLFSAQTHLGTSYSPPLPRGDVSGLIRTGDNVRIPIFNGSHSTISEEEALHTVLLFPDFKAIIDVASTSEGGENLWRSYVDPAVGRIGALLEGSGQKSYVLPYFCVIHICSHKSRDNRCAIAAQKLEPAFIQCLESEGWTVHTQLQHSCFSQDSAIESQDEEQRESYILNRLKALSASKQVLILKNSHLGGHKFAGNCVIHIPNGSSVWYGRVTPHHVPAIVQQTIIEGKVLPPLLRACADVAQPSRQCLYDW